jgi:UDP-N-acetylglucosamine 2-epimerase
MQEIVNVLVVGGVRPQFIKMAALEWAISKYNTTSPFYINAKYVNTGQHYDSLLSSQIVEELGLSFDFNFSYSDRDPISIMGNMFIEFSKVLDAINPRPDWVIVMGDATTTFVGAVVAARKGYPVVHLEAGVRSGTLASIEEMHRRIVSHISTVHFCTSRTGVDNLKNENITNNVYWTGDIAHDYIVDSANQNNKAFSELKGNYILLTLHKPSNIDSPTHIKNLISILSSYTRQTLFIVHPRTKKKLLELGISSNVENVKFCDALTYKSMLSTLKGCSFAITDSGGLQREAYYLKKRCLVRRESVGWTNFIDANVHRLIGGELDGIKAGLEWAEKSLHEDYPNIDEEFIRNDSWMYAFDTLVNLTHHSKNNSV